MLAFGGRRRHHDSAGAPDATDAERVFPEGLLGWLALPPPWRFALFCAVGAGAAAVAWLLVPPSEGLTADGRRTLFILLVAAGLWVSEAIPAFAVGILVIALQTLLLGRPASGDGDWERHVLVLGDPLIWLFFGGLVLAAGMHRTGVDRWLASRALRPFMHRQRRLLLAVAAIAFASSMVMSNTATAAMMLALIAPIVDARPAGDRFARRLILAVPAGANIGGMASLVGTPPNAIAAGLLADQTDTTITFARWVTIGLPPALVLEAILLALLLWGLKGAAAEANGIARGGRDTAPVPRRYGHTASGTPNWQVLWVCFTLVVTLGLWLTQELHGLPTPVVAVAPVVLLTATGILDVESFRALPYDVLFLLAGGLALGQAIQETGLASWLVGFVDLAALPVAAFTVLAGTFAVVLSNVMSNTAAANVLVPLVLSASVTAGEPAALTVALCASAAMALPVATPPNALASATGRVGARDFLLLGLAAGVVTPLLATGWVLLAF